MIRTENPSSSASFYVIGGTLRRDAPSYVVREADNSLYRALTRGEFCYVLTARQMGKSSLMVRTAAQLREEHAAVAVIDLTALGQNLSIEQWYNGLLERVGQQLGLEDELEEAWLENQSLGPLHRWMRSIRQVLLAHRSGPIVVFIDEIDAVRSLSFSTDEFFAGIRELYNRRSQDAELNRLTFCLLGVATPSDLIRDTRTTPFNVGRRIELTDFTEEEAAPLALGMGHNIQIGSHLLRRVLYWTGGHPYLTQRVCRSVADDRAHTPSAVDRICSDLFLSVRARDHDDNLLFVRERMLRSEADTPSLLTLFDKVRSGKKVQDDETDPLVPVLRLSGITRTDNGYLKVRNRVYEKVFDRAWVMSNMPGAELRRQRVAYKRGIKVAAVVFGIITLVAAGIYVNRVYNEVTPPPSVASLPPPPFWASFSITSAAAMNTGALLVKTEDANVAIFVNNRQFGRTAQDGTLNISGLAPGAYTIRAEKPGFQSISLQIEIKAQSATQASFKLEAQAQTLALGSMMIEAAPAGAQVTLDGRPQGVTSESGGFQLTAAPGVHSIGVSKEGYLPGQWTRDFKVGEKVSQAAQLRPDVELQRWTTASSAGDLQTYLRDYPEGRFAAQARERILQLEWSSLKDRTDAGAVMALADFLERCRQGPPCSEARVRMNSLKGEDEEWVKDRDSQDITELQSYLSKYPQGRYTPLARDLLAKRNDEKQIRSLIEQYGEAYNRRDMEGLIALWPTFPPSSQQRTRDLFKAAKSVSLTFAIGDTQINGNSAVVTCKRTRDVVRTDEAGGHTQDSVVFRMSRQGDHWTIESGPR